MDDLVQWLGEQLDEDERVARSCSGAEWREHPKGWVSAPPMNRVAVVVDDGDRAHIARHDPARVLREIDAARRRLERHTPESMVGYHSDVDDQSTYVLGCPTCQVDVVSKGDWPCEEMRDLLVVYADRPGYREEWRP